MPTTFHVVLPNLRSLPSVSPRKRPTAAFPTLISRMPGANLRPSTNVIVSRTSNAFGPTPRAGTFAG